MSSMLKILSENPSIIDRYCKSEGEIETETKLIMFSVFVLIDMLLSYKYNTGR